MKGSRLRAKGEKIIFDTEDGKKTYILRPLKNRQLLEIVELGDKKDPKSGMQATIKLAKYSLNRDKKIQDGVEESFTDEEIEDMETPFLMQILKLAVKINGLETVMDFQVRDGAGQLTPNPSVPMSRNDILDRNLQALNRNPAKKVS